MADDTDTLKARVITQAFVAGQMDAQLKHADEATRPSLKLLQAKTYAMAQESMNALVAAVRAEHHAPLLAKAVIELWSQTAPQDADDWLYQARQVAGQIGDEPGYEAERRQQERERPMADKFPALQAMKVNAEVIVRRHAALHAPKVEARDVDAICRALGDISVDEATAALDRIERERQATS